MTRRLTCKDCREITRSQRQCINCGGKTIRAKTTLHGAPGGPGNAGPGPHRGWHCPRCRVLWDGGKMYGFACPRHGGHEPELRPSKNLPVGSPIGDYEGAN